jgi:hypothetical protein
MINTTYLHDSLKSLGVQIALNFDTRNTSRVTIDIVVQKT